MPFCQTLQRHFLSEAPSFHVTIACVDLAKVYPAHFHYMRLIGTSHSRCGASPTNIHAAGSVCWATDTHNLHSHWSPLIQRCPSLAEWTFPTSHLAGTHSKAHWPLELYSGLFPSPGQHMRHLMGWERQLSATQGRGASIPGGGDAL